ncbi:MULTISPECIES: FHA domain-containing protein [unclassified Spirulina]|uniref:FHA domain-containing protein n=1 Tax=unclassified Spirulina TaxID=2684457 RepID=UPI00195281C6|nr:MULTISPECIES: FHA domain-containing protein [Spirulina]MEA5470532.1 FHA domain-containing protein [Spirulina sp. 06S082]
MAAKTAKIHQEHILIVEDENGRRSLPLLEASYSIGREETCDVYLKSPFVSRHHAMLYRRLREDGSIYYRIVDGDDRGNLSSNGVVVNGTKKPEHDLEHNDQLVFGNDVMVTYRQQTIPEASASDDPYDITLIDPAMMMDD